MVRSIRAGRGLTLIELLIIAAILGAVAAFLPPLFRSSLGYIGLMSKRAPAVRDGRIVMDRVSRSLREARAATIQIGSEPGQPPFSKITFVNVSGSSVTVWQEGQMVKMQQGDAPSVLTRNAGRLLFTFPVTSSLTTLNVSLVVSVPRSKGAGGTVPVFQENLTISQ